MLLKVWQHEKVPLLTIILRIIIFSEKRKKDMCRLNLLSYWLFFSNDIDSDAARVLADQ